MSESDCLYNVDELAERAGVSRRTVRYYIQRGLLPPPLGLGRGKHYTESHLTLLIRIRELQEDSVPLDAITERLLGTTSQPVTSAMPTQSNWTRVVLTDDVELHLRGRRLTEEQIGELTRAVETLLGGIVS